MDTLALFAVLSVLVWKLTEHFQALGLDGKIGRIHVPNVVALALGLVVAFGAQLDIFAAYHIAFPHPFIAWILTGLLLGGGASLVNSAGDALASIPKGK